MSDADKAKLLLQLLDGATFPGSQRNVVVELAEWLETLRDERLKTVPAGD